MRRLLFFFVFLITSVIAFGQEYYSISADVLNIRSAPDKSSEVVGVFRKGDVIQAELSSDSAWYIVSYKGKIGYVSSSYLEYEYSAEDVSKQDKANVARMSLLSLSQYGKDALSSFGLPYVNEWLLLGVTALLLLILTFLVVADCSIAAKLIFLLLSSCSVIYFLYVSIMNGFAFFPDGWIWYIVALIVLGLATFATVFSTMSVMNHLMVDLNAPVLWTVGWGGWVVAALVLVLDAIFGWNITSITLLVLLLFQALFCIYIIITFIRFSHVKLAAIPVVLIYLLSSFVATVLLTAFALSMLILFISLLVIGFLLSALAGGGSGGRSSSGKYRTSSGETLTELGPNYFQDEYGKKWRSDGGSKVWRED